MRAHTHAYLRACSCLDGDPRRRPGAEELVQALSGLSASSRPSLLLAQRRRLSTLSNKVRLRAGVGLPMRAADEGC